jgi:transmembrane sensor
MVTGSKFEDDHDAAVHWATRLDGEPLSVEEQQALDVWILEDERRRGSLLRAEAALAFLDRGRALSETGRETEGGVRSPNLGRRGFLIGGSLSALVATVAFGLFLVRYEPTTYQTALGEVRRVPLADGSIASINTDSKLAVVMQENRRKVKLESGEAWFQVAKDKARPFIVEAGHVRVEAVGTAFSVRRRDTGADVLVTEGVVDVWIEGSQGAHKRIAAGSRTFVRSESPAIKAVNAWDDVERQLAWRTGELALNGESLAYAASELNRYNRRKLLIEDPQLAEKPLVGYFRTDQPENFARAVATMLDARLRLEGDTIRLSR